MNGKKGLSILALTMSAVVLATSLTACSSSGRSPRNMAAAGSGTASQAADYAADGAAPAAGTAQTKSLSGQTAATTSEAAASNSAAAAAQATRKIIERLNYVIETLKFDESVGQIQTLCGSLGGYVQDSNVTGSGIMEKGTLRHANYTLRIPQEKLAQMKSSAESIGTILSFTSSSENVSDQYYDTEARLKSLRTQQERLLALLQKSGSLADVVTLEKALADVNYQIEELTGTLKKYDSLINYSTVVIQLNEVVQPTKIEREPVTLWERIGSRFQQSASGLASFGEGFLVFLLGCSPVLIFLLVIALIIYWFAWGKKHRRQKKTPPENSQENDHSDKKP